MDIICGHSNMVAGHMDGVAGQSNMLEGHTKHVEMP